MSREEDTCNPGVRSSTFYDSRDMDTTQVFLKLILIENLWKQLSRNPHMSNYFHLQFQWVILFSASVKMLGKLDFTYSGA